MPVKYSVSARKNPQNPDMGEKFYGMIQSTDVINLDQLCEHIAQHGTIWTTDLVSGVLTKLVSCLEELLVDGYTVKLGNFGSFRLSAKSMPAETIDQFNSTKFTKVYPVWSKGSVFKNLKNSRLGMSFERVLTKKEDALAKERIYGAAKDDNKD